MTADRSRGADSTNFYSPAGEWAWHEHEARAFYEVCAERNLRVWPLCRRDVNDGPLSEQAAFLIQ